MTSANDGGRAVSLDGDRDAKRTLDWNGVDAELQLLEQATVAVVIEGSGRSRVSVIRPMRRIELPFDRCLGFAYAWGDRWPGAHRG